MTIFSPPDKLLEAATYSHLGRAICCTAGSSGLLAEARVNAPEVS